MERRIPRAGNEASAALPDAATSLSSDVRLSDNSAVIGSRAVALAFAAAAACAGCSSSHAASHPTASVARVPIPTEDAAFDLAAYDAHHANSASASRLLGGCLDQFSGSVVQAALERPLAKLHLPGRGTGIGVMFQPDATPHQQRAVEACLLRSGAHVRG